jgi:hypothetical protein
MECKLIQLSSPEGRMKTEIKTLKNEPIIFALIFPFLAFHSKVHNESGLGFFF